MLTGPAQGATVLAGQQHTASTFTPADQPRKPSGILAAQQHASANPTQQAPIESAHQPSADIHLERVLLSHDERVLLSHEQGASGANSGATASQSSPAHAVVRTVQGTDVSQELSAVKVVSAVTDVDAQAFHRFLLHSLRQ